MNVDLSNTYIFSTQWVSLFFVVRITQKYNLYSLFSQEKMAHNRIITTTHCSAPITHMKNETIYPSRAAAPEIISISSVVIRD